MTPSEITDDLSKQAATKYADFMNTQAYKDYTTAYDKFIKKNPGYEEKIAAKLKQLSEQQYRILEGMVAAE